MKQEKDNEIKEIDEISGIDSSIANLPEYIRRVLEQIKKRQKELPAPKDTISPPQSSDK
jgi:hypothetical protein